MHLLNLGSTFICAISISFSAAAALPQIDNGLGAQLGDGFAGGFSAVMPSATITQEPPSPSSPVDAAKQDNSPPVQVVQTHPTNLNSSSTGLALSRTTEASIGNTTPATKDDSLEAQTPNAINTVYDTSTNTTAISVPITANTTSPPPPIQDNGLLAQDTNPKDIAFVPNENSTVNIDPQPVNDSISISPQETGVPQSQQQRQPPPQPSGDGLQAQLNATKIDFQPQPAPSSSKIAAPSIPIPTSTSAPSSPPSPTANNTITSSTAAAALPTHFPQDDGLEAQDVSGTNADFSSQTNTTAINYPHQFHDPRTGELLVPPVQDDGLQAQDSGGANVMWAPGQAYGGGLGGDINVPTAVEENIVEDRR